MTRNISIDTVRAAASRIYSVAARTPLIRLDPIGRGAPEIFLKLEVFQPIGSFKIRGAMNAVAQLPPSAMPDGVWTVSAGNAAQGVALAAREAGARASVLVMDGAPATKLTAIERLGATIVKAPFDECWKAVEHARIRSHDGPARPSRSTTTTSSAATARPPSRFSKTCRTSTPSSRRWAAAVCSAGIGVVIER